MGEFQSLDWIVVAGYFMFVFGIAFYAGLQRTSGKSSQDYFLAGKNVGWFVIGASLFASNIGSEHLVGLAGTGAASGVAVAQFEILAGIILLLLGWVFVPFYLKSGVFTMPEFLERRYSSGPRLYLAVISIVGYVLTKISVTIAAGGIVFTALMGVDFWTGALIVVVATGIYTIWGGLRAVLYTDLLQLFVLLAGAIAVTVLGLQHVGGWSGLQQQVDLEYFNLWKPMTHPDFPWTGVLFGAPILGVWYWCTDQFIVQRVLAAKDISNARKGTIFAAILKQLPLFLFVLPGIIAFALVNTGQLTLNQPDEALPALIEALLPAGLRGLVAAGLLAALMSSLSSVFNSCSTLFTIDIYQRVHREASERTLVIVGRIATLCLVALGLLWIPFMKLISGQLFTYIQSVQAYISPPIAAVFLIGIVWPRANARGAIAALSTGFVFGIARLILEMNKADLSGAALWVASINFLHYAIFLFAVSVAALVIGSLLGPKPPREKTETLTFAGRRGSADKAASGLNRRDMVYSSLVLLLIAAVWLSFSPLGLA
ncbi:MAG: sodium:solute symporter [Pseudomonadota bacterium]